MYLTDRMDNDSMITPNLAYNRISGPDHDMNQIDTFLTSDPTPKAVSRRTWRRRRMRRGKT